MKVLIVDDDLWILSGMRKVLQRDYDVKVTDDGEAAIAIAKRFQPDVVFVDLILKWTNGLDVIKELRHLLPNANLILMTGYVGGDASEEAFAHGANWFLGKEELALACTILDRVVASRHCGRRGALLASLLTPSVPPPSHD